MAQVLIIVSDQDFDPSEAAIPWQVLTNAGHDVYFASGSGGTPQCDPITLMGEGLPSLAKSLAARPDNVRVYAAMRKDKNFQTSKRWRDIDPENYDALVLPGGHAEGVKPYLESAHVHNICKEFFARKAPVSSVCHGILALARARREDGKSILYGYKVTGLTSFQENLAIKLTKSKLGTHYQTYPETVQEEVSKVLKSPSDFKSGPLIPAFGTQDNPNKGFVVEDDHLLCGRWPGDVYKLAYKLNARLT